MGGRSLRHLTIPSLRRIGGLALSGRMPEHVATVTVRRYRNHCQALRLKLRRRGYAFSAAQCVDCRIGRAATMAEFFPVRASGPREPARPRPIPPKIKAVVHYLVWGRDDADPDALPMTLLDACAAAGIRPFVARRHLDRPQTIAFLRQERRKYREILCSGNERALQRVRDGSNAMAAVASVRALDQLQAEDAGRATAVSPGITLRIICETPQPAPIVDVTPSRIIDSD